MTAPSQPPSSEVEYEAAALQDGAGQQAGVTQLAAEKAALKRQLRQLDADFAVPPHSELAPCPSLGSVAAACLRRRGPAEHFRV